MITIVGIDHTQQMDNKLKKLIYSKKPEVICLELDEFRFKQLSNKVTEKEIQDHYKNIPSIYKMMSLFKRKSQKKSKVKRSWDSEMIITLAEEMKFKIIPIDKDQMAVYWDIENQISFLEKTRIFFSIHCSNLLYVKPEKNNEDLEKNFNKEFPTLKHNLIDVRNEYMSKEIKKIAESYKNIMVIIGKAHLTGINILIKDLHPVLLDLKIVK